MLVVQSIRGGAETVKAERLAHLGSLSLNASNNFLDLRVLINEGLSVDECVGSHPSEDLLFVLGIHIDATDGQLFYLSKEVIVRLLDGTLVRLPSFKELHIQSSSISHFAIEPCLDCGVIGVGKGDSGAAFRKHELELTGLVELEELLDVSRLRRGRLWGLARRIVRYNVTEVYVFLGLDNGNDSGESK